jgi:cation transport ATPase
VLTGDNEITASAIAAELGIDDVKADLKPEHKIEAIKELEQNFRAGSP